MKASVSVVIQKPIADVFAFVTRIRNLDSWVPGSTRPTQTSAGDFGVGATFAGRCTYGGRAHGITYRVTEFRPLSRFAVQATSGPFPFQGLLELEPAGGGTKVTHTVATRPDGPATRALVTLFGPLLRLPLGRPLRRELVSWQALLQRTWRRAGGGFCRSNRLPC
jgi:uncharacterized protein YndB with AHSA1/START domain